MGAHARDEEKSAGSRSGTTRRRPGRGRSTTPDNAPAYDAANRPGRATPEQLVALQRTMGNAAVIRMLQRERHTHDASCGHQPPVPPVPPVQRSTTVHDVLRGPGRPLDAAVSADMEGRLGADFSDVRLHTGPAAQRSAAEIGARAYTSGSHVVIGEGGADKETLAHELIHVIQQRQGPVAGTDTGDGLAVSDPGDRFEREAAAGAARAVSGPAPAGTGAAAVEHGTDHGGATRTDAVQRVFTDARGRRISRERLAQSGLLTELVEQFHPDVRAYVELVVDVLTEDDERVSWDDVMDILQEDFDVHPGVQQAPPQLPLAPQAAPQHTTISLADEASFLESIASIWHIRQGNTGCGLLGNTLYLSSSSANRPAFFNDIWDAVEDLRANTAALPGWFPTAVEVCPGYVGTTANHAECRIMKVWGDGGGAGAIIRTTQPACADCAHLMGEQGVRHDNAAQRSYGKTGWIHPFTLQAYGPQITGSPRYAP
ncbi:eCIS core domain-containing protein [Streptomyces sp. NPDC054796]